MKLLTAEIRRLLPALDEDAGGGDAVAIVKYFTPDSSWSWHAVCGGQQGDDFIFFGLVDGYEKELGYFSLAELESARGPLGLRIERDLYWRPRPLRQIAPELFSDGQAKELL
jgi:hypothetical protein